MQQQSLTSKPPSVGVVVHRTPPAPTRLPLLSRFCRRAHSICSAMPFAVHFTMPIAVVLTIALGAAGTGCSTLRVLPLTPGPGTNASEEERLRYYSEFRPLSLERRAVGSGEKVRTVVTAAVLPNDVRVERPDDLSWGVRAGSPTDEAIHRWRDASALLAGLRVGSAATMAVSSVAVAGGVVLTTLALRSTSEPKNALNGKVDAGVGVGVGGIVGGATLLGTAILTYALADVVLEPQIEEAQTAAFETYDTSLRQRLALQAGTVDELRARIAKLTPPPPMASEDADDATDDSGAEPPQQDQR